MVAPIEAANDAMTVPQTRPNSAPAASVRTAAPGSDSAGDGDVDGEEDERRLQRIGVPPGLEPGLLALQHLQVQVATEPEAEPGGHGEDDDRGDPPPLARSELHGGGSPGRKACQPQRRRMAIVAAQRAAKT